MIDGRDERFHHVADNGLIEVHALGTLAAAHDDEVGDADCPSRLGAGLAPNQCTVAARHVAFAGLRMVAIELLRNDQPQHAVAEKFQALVILGLSLAARMGQCVAQKRLVTEIVSDPGRDGVVLQLAEADHAGQSVLNSRFQRMTNGHRQTSRRDASGEIEKKMMSARPTKFSIGT